MSGVKVQVMKLEAMSVVCFELINSCKLLNDQVEGTCMVVKLKLYSIKLQDLQI